MNRQTRPLSPNLTTTRFGDVPPLVRFRFDATGCGCPHGRTVKYPSNPAPVRSRSRPRPARSTPPWSSRARDLEWHRRDGAPVSILRTRCRHECPTAAPAAPVCTRPHPVLHPSRRQCPVATWMPWQRSWPHSVEHAAADTGKDVAQEVTAQTCDRRASSRCWRLAMCTCRDLRTQNSTAINDADGDVSKRYRGGNIDP